MWKDAVATRTNVDGLDSNAFFEVGRLRAIRNLVGEHLRLAEGIHESGATSTRGTYMRIQT